jgi:KEOPS complex subunit Cgi121
MPRPPVSCDIRAAFCTSRDRPSFLGDLQAIAAANATHIICFNADMMAGTRHVKAAVAQAVRAFEEGTNISNTLEMEALLYAAGSRQCNIGASFGIHEGENRLYLCCTPAPEGIRSALEPLFTFPEEDWDVIDREKEERLRKLFAISSEEIAAAGGVDRITDLVLERVALLQVLR